MSWKTDKTGKERRDLVFSHVCHAISVMYFTCFGNNKHVSHRKTKRGNCFSCEGPTTHCIVLHADLKSQNSTDMTSPRCWLITELVRIRQFRFELSNWFLLYNYCHSLSYYIRLSVRSLAIHSFHQMLWFRANRVGVFSQNSL